MIDTEEEKENSHKCKTIHLLHTREPLCLHRANKIKSNESNLLAKVPHPIQSGIQTTSLQEIHKISVSVLHNSSSSEKNTDNIFLRHNRAVSSTARNHLAGNILDEVRAKKHTFGRLSHKIIPGNNSLIIEEYIPACLWTIFDKMAPEETDFERNPAQKQFRVTRNS